MKIISRGTPPETKPVRFECRKCKTVFETTQAEVRRVSDQRDGDFWQHTCPICAYLCTSAVKS